MSIKLWVIVPFQSRSFMKTMYTTTLEIRLKIRMKFICKTKNHRQRTSLDLKVQRFCFSIVLSISNIPIIFFSNKFISNKFVQILFYQRKKCLGVDWFSCNACTSKLHMQETHKRVIFISEISLLFSLCPSENYYQIIGMILS